MKDMRAPITDEVWVAFIDKNAPLRDYMTEYMDYFINPERSRQYWESLYPGDDLDQRRLVVIDYGKRKHDS